MHRPAGVALMAVAGVLSARAVAADAPAYRLATHVSLEYRDEAPSFVCLDGLQLLDRGRLVQIGRAVERRNVITVLDLRTLKVREVTIPGLPGKQVPARTEMGPDRPLFYDTGNAAAGILLRAGGLVTGDAEYAAWDLAADRITGRMPLAAVGEAKWMSVQPIGYDPGRREGFVEVIRFGVRLKTSPNQGGHYDVSVLAVTDRVREVAAWTFRRPTTAKSPYFDPVHRRSMHIEYSEHAGTFSTATLVDLNTGATKSFELPPIVYGFAFDPDGRTGYVYTERSGEVFRLDLETGAEGPRRKYGRRGHLIEFVAPGILLLGRNAGLHFLDARSLRERWFLGPGAFTQAGSAHLEGSVFLPGRALIRNSWDLTVLDFPGLGGRRAGGPVTSGR